MEGLAVKDGAARICADLGRTDCGLVVSFPSSSTGPGKSGVQAMQNSYKNSKATVATAGHIFGKQLATEKTVSPVLGGCITWLAA